MELRVEVADAASLLARIQSAVRAGRLPGWRRNGDHLLTRIDDTDVAFDARLDTPPHPPHAPHPPIQFLILRATGNAENSKVSDAITRLELAIRNHFVTPRLEREPVDDYGSVHAEFTIRE